MQARYWGIFAAVAVLQAGVALAACPPGPNRGCVNLDGVPDITQQIVAREPQAKPANKDGAAAIDATKPYTGPTVGVTNTVRRAPTVGYRWSLD